MRNLLCVIHVKWFATIIINSWLAYHKLIVIIRTPIHCCAQPLKIFLFIVVRILIIIFVNISPRIEYKWHALAVWALINGAFVNCSSFINFSLYLQRRLWSRRANYDARETKKKKATTHQNISHKISKSNDIFSIVCDIIEYRIHILNERSQYHVTKVNESCVFCARIDNEFSNFFTEIGRTR